MSAAGAFELSAGGDGRLRAAGPLTFATARAARLAGLSALAAAGGAATIDCSDLSACDSAGLAVVLDWLAAAKLGGHSLKLVALPQDLRALARISEVAELLERGV